jgi:3-oxoadipate CoA-transferase beta subunit
MSPLLDKTQMAAAVAADLADGSYVNLGIGLPILVARALSLERDIVVHSENGILGMSSPAEPGEEDWDLIDAAKSPVTLRAGGSYLSHADSFAIIRGGHLDVSVMGAFQVSAGGDLANWWNAVGIPGVGGAMDLAVGARQVFVMMKHTTPEGRPKLLTHCTMPLTAAAVVNRVYSDYGIFEPAGDGSFRVLGLAAGITLDDVATVTNAPLILSPDVRALGSSPIPE